VHFVKLAAHSPFAPVQVESEICGLLELVAEHRPRHVLEIGTARGGTLYLLSKMVHPEALMVTVDIQPRYQSELLRSFARGKTTVELLAGNSSEAALHERIRGLFPQGLDLLFLDGDHSYEGVSRDFALYRPLVRAGGMIVFHDIVEDNRTRYGVDTGGWTGGVPRFWAEVKQGKAHRELVQDWAQDGCGIGVLFVVA
jgi:predicted O-methyltransferase YrrM